MRINARLDAEHEAKLQYLAKSSNRNYSDVVKEALDVYYAKARGEAESSLAVLRDSGLIGVADGDRDLSENYKDSLAQSLDDKHGDR